MQRATARECGRADTGKLRAFRKGYRLQLRTAVKGVGINGLDCSGDFDPPQLFRAVEGVLRNGFDATGQIDLGKGGAVLECRRADIHACGMINKHDFGKGGTIVECVCADAVDRLRADQACEGYATVKRVLSHAVGVGGEGDGNEILARAESVRVDVFGRGIECTTYKCF